MQLLLKLIPLALAAVIVSQTSCSSSSVGDQLAAQEAGPARALGEEWKRADKMVAKGKARQKDGQKLIKKGNRQIEEGKEIVKNGERIKAETELAARRSGFLKGAE